MCDQELAQRRPLLMSGGVSRRWCAARCGSVEVESAPLRRSSLRRVCSTGATPGGLSRRRWAWLCGSLASAWLLNPGSPSQARIPTETLSPFYPQPLTTERYSPPPRSAPSNRDPDIKSKVTRIQEMTRQAEGAAGEGQYRKVCFTQGRMAIPAGSSPQALELYSQIVQLYPDLAVTEYARLHRALLLYEVGDIRRSLLELDDLEISLRGFPEVHAALASVLYVERPLQLNRAEAQWDLATSFDRRYSDPSWVRATKKWPPRLMSALERFLDLL